MVLLDIRNIFMSPLGFPCPPLYYLSNIGSYLSNDCVDINHYLWHVSLLNPVG